MITKKEKTYRILMIVMFVFALGWTIFLLINSGLSVQASSANSEHVEQIIENTINSVAPNTINGSNRYIADILTRKVIGHFGAFFLLGFFVSLGMLFVSQDIKDNKKGIRLIIIITIIYGIFIGGLSELIQLGTEGRSAEINDVLINYGGYFSSCLIIFLANLIHYLVSKHKKKLLSE